LLYVANDASFNEALATMVQEEGVKRWLQRQGRDKDLADHLLQLQRYMEVIALMNKTRADLRVLYASGLPPPLMRERKRETFEAMRESYAALKAQWGGNAPFDAWFAGDINNAHLASIATYYVWVPGFERELKAVGGDLPAFYRRVRALAKLDQSRRDTLICGTPASP
jgi:predicted aminopeptidase